MIPFIVYGGPSSENEVSKHSKDLFLEILNKYNPILVEWKKDFSFCIYPENLILDIEEFFKYMKAREGVFVNAMHGEYCEDGWIQEKLENAKISFTGPSSEAARLSMDKVKSQEIVKDIVKIIPTQVFTINTEESKKKLFNSVSTSDWKYPLFMKPNAKGSSVGIYKLHNDEELKEIALKLEPDTYLVQPAIEGTEISIGVVNDNGSFLDLPATEILPQGEFFDYKSKYAKGGSNEITPARISEEAMKMAKKISIEVHKKLNLGCYSRTDFILSKVENCFYYLETNSLPGMSSTSLLPQQLRIIKSLDQFGDILLRNLNRF